MENGDITETYSLRSIDLWSMDRGVQNTASGTYFIGGRGLKIKTAERTGKKWQLATKGK